MGFPLGLMCQELRKDNRSIPSKEHQSIKEIAAELFPLSIDRTPPGPFSVERFVVPINLMDINPSESGNENLDILAISRTQEQKRKAQIRSVNTSRQLDQIKAQVRVFLNQDQRNRDIYNRANNDLNYDKRTPDGGIRNEALRDIRQPFMTPYYDYYGRRGYSPYGYRYPRYYWR